MTLSLSVNGTVSEFEIQPDERLITVLRSAKLFSVKHGCSKGQCGSCTVLMNGLPVPSCIIPAAAAQHAEIITLEYFQKTADYNDIQAGFDEAGILLCGYCNSGKIFTAHTLLKKYPRPEKDRVRAAVDSFTCSCTEKDTLVNGILFAGTIRRARLANEARTANQGATRNVKH